MTERERCIDCKALAPPTETNHTLISSKHGWRLIRALGPDGTFVVEWRCKACWERRKQQTVTATGAAKEPTNDTAHSAFARARRKLTGFKPPSE